jgi:hypothetical protein
VNTIICPLLKSEMRAVLMMVTNILEEQSLQMAFISAQQCGDFGRKFAWEGSS